MDISKIKQRSFTSEVAVRIVLYIIFYITDDAVPFERKIQPEEIWLYRYPRTRSIYPGYLLWITVLTTPVVIVGLFYIVRKSKEDLIQGLLGVFLSMFLTASVTNFVKLAVGRPRPDYLERCFPDGDIKASMICTGEYADVIQGRKSFPSGHSSFAFSCMAFLSFYMAGKFHVFTSKGRGSGLKVCCVTVPMVWATLIAISRTADYHHHWQDVTIGSLLGIAIAYMVYRQYYPGLTRPHCDVPYSEMKTQGLQLELPPLTPTTPGLPQHSMDSVMKMV